MGGSFFGMGDRELIFKSVAPQLVVPDVVRTAEYVRDGGSRRRRAALWKSGR